MTTVCQFENRLSANDVQGQHEHSHDHGHGHSHDAAAEHGHTHEHLEHAGEFGMTYDNTVVC